MASYKSYVKKRPRRGTTSEYIPASSQTPPIFPASIQTTRGWDMGVADDAKMFEWKNWDIPIDFACTVWNTPAPGGTPALSDTNGWLEYPAIKPEIQQGKWGKFFPLQGLLQGSSETQRVGRMIMICEISFLIRFVIGEVAEKGACVRLVLLKDNQTNGEGPSTVGGNKSAVFKKIGGIYESPSIYTMLQNPTDLSNSERFEIFYDKVLDFQPAMVPERDGTWTRFNCITVTERIPMEMKVEFSGDTGTVADVRSNSWWLMLAAHGGQEGDTMQRLSASGFVRTRFIDP